MTRLRVPRTTSGLLLACVLVACGAEPADAELGAGGQAGGSAPAAGSAGLPSAGTGAGGVGSGGVAGAGPDRPPSTASSIAVSGRQLMVGRRLADGTLEPPAPYAIEGVGWSPMPVGSSNTAGYAPHYTAFAAQDVPLIAGLGANTVKTYNAFELDANGTALLDQLYESGVMVIMTVMPSYWDFESGAYLEAVDFFKGHPAILMWLVGNELNYNTLYNGELSLEQAVETARVAIDAIHLADSEHPVAVSWGNAPSPDQLSTLAAADVWSLNLYPHLALDDRFAEWLELSQKPMFVGEYGADAYNATLAAEDQAAQAEATRVLTEQIQAASSAVDPNAAALGGCVFELADEWWKAPGTSASAQDPGGFENSGVYPDGVANEEWWGLVTVDRQPRQAYQTLQELYATR